jgi:hypothetical protein
MIHPGLAALEKGEPIEYAAGYRARLAAIPDLEIAHHCWRCGWEDADTEALELDRHKRVLADGGEDAYAESIGVVATSNRKPPLRILIWPLIRPWPAGLVPICQQSGNQPV